MAAIDLKVREQKVRELAVQVEEAKQLLAKIEGTANQYGIEFSMSLGGRSHWFVPKRPEGVTEDDIEGTDWLESEDDSWYGESTGWKNSSSNC